MNIALFTGGHITAVHLSKPFKYFLPSLHFIDSSKEAELKYTITSDNPDPVQQKSEINASIRAIKGIVTESKGKKVKIRKDLEKIIDSNFIEGQPVKISQEDFVRLTTELIDPELVKMHHGSSIEELTPSEYIKNTKTR